jgi:hypothetical protein
MERDKNWFGCRITAGTEDGHTDGDMLGTQDGGGLACLHQEQLGEPQTAALGETVWTWVSAVARLVSFDVPCPCHLFRRSSAGERKLLDVAGEGMQRSVSWGLTSALNLSSTQPLTDAVAIASLVSSNRGMRRDTSRSLPKT